MRYAKPQSHDFYWNFLVCISPPRAFSGQRCGAVHLSAFLMRALRSVVTTCLWLLVGAVALEACFRAYLVHVSPERFPAFLPKDASYAVADSLRFLYDSELGYTLPRGKTIYQTSIRPGLSVVCAPQSSINAQGNLGPVTDGFEQADARILVFGDSFTAMDLDGLTWPVLLERKLEKQLGKTVRVMNLAREGYAAVQAIHFAALTAKGYRPTVVVIALNATAYRRGRFWRVTTGEGDDVRLLTTPENSHQPTVFRDYEMVMPSATRPWCEALRQKPIDEQAKDPVLQKIFEKRARLNEDNRPVGADVWTPKSSFILDLLLYRDAFRSVWISADEATNPILHYDDYAKDPQVVVDLKALRESGIPVLFVNLPIGAYLKDGLEVSGDARDQRLLTSLSTLQMNVFKTTDFVKVAREDALKMCKFPYDCHPSIFAMDVYSDAVAAMLLKSGSLAGH